MCHNQFMLIYDSTSSKCNTICKPLIYHEIAVNLLNIVLGPANKKVLRQLRKPFSLGLNFGYGAVVDVKSGNISTGPYFGIGITYSPKFLQWGK